MSPYVIRLPPNFRTQPAEYALYAKFKTLTIINGNNEY
jgi:hypothetical protein